MEENNKISKVVILMGSIVATITYILLNLFLNGKIIDIPKGTLEGGIMTIVGYGAIIITTTILSMVILLLLKKKSKKK